METIIKKVVALQVDLSSMTIGLVGAIKDAIRCHFVKVFQNDKAILAAVTSPKFKLKWVESQTPKDLYNSGGKRGARRARAPQLFIKGSRTPPKICVCDIISIS